MISAALASFRGFGMEDGHVATFWSLLHSVSVVHRPDIATPLGPMGELAELTLPKTGKMYERTRITSEP